MNNRTSILNIYKLSNYLILESELGPLVNEHLQIFEYSDDLKVLDNVVSASIHPAYKKK